LECEVVHTSAKFAFARSGAPEPDDTPDWRGAGSTPAHRETVARLRFPAAGANVFAKALASNATFTSLMSCQASTGNKPCPSSQRDTEPTAVISGFPRRFPSRYFAVSARAPPR